MSKKILITGASSGIGREVSIKLSKLGYNCILIGRNLNELEVTLKLMSGSDHLIFSGDINDQTFIDHISSQVEELSGIVHSAGIIKLSPIKFINKGDFEKIMNTNLYAPFFITQALIKNKKLLNDSSIIFISSISGPIIGSKGNLMYSASKSAINGIVKVLALELAEKKIRVNAISAGMIYSEMWKENNTNSVSSEQLSLDSKKYPLGYGEPSDVASLVSFLTSQESKWITGSTIVLDGGFTIQ
jgi:NAD(P)-dependent dehydrogenase (short-subunit alcohol dehydrogenase family)